MDYFRTFLLFLILPWNLVPDSLVVKPIYGIVLELFFPTLQKEKSLNLISAKYDGPYLRYILPGISTLH